MTEAQVYGGHRDAARRYADRLTHSVALPQWRVGAAALLARMGEGAHARAMLQQLAAEPRPLPQTPTMRAMLYAGLGDTTHLMDALEAATAAHEPWPTWYSLSERYFDAARSSARFGAIVRSVGLDDRIFTSPNGGRSP